MSTETLLGLALVVSMGLSIAWLARKLWFLVIPLLIFAWWYYERFGELPWLASLERLLSRDEFQDFARSLLEGG